MSFSPTDAREAAILDVTRPVCPHVSNERLLSASGIELIYRAIGQLSKKPSAVDCAGNHRARTDRQIERVRGKRSVFCGMMGTAAANLAVTLGHSAASIIGGRSCRASVRTSMPRRSARDSIKGPFSNYVAQIPAFVITAENATFTGLAAVLDAQLKRRGQGSSVLDRIHQAQADCLRPSGGWPIWCSRARVPSSTIRSAKSPKLPT